MLSLLLGREPELATIDELLHGAADHGGALLVSGEPGVGKSALLEAAARHADELGQTVLRTAGSPSETQMAFSGLHALLRPELGRIADLADAQRDALSAAFGLGNGAAPDVFLIALATLNLLADAAADAPLVVLAEDAQWLDADTCDVLAFVARRVESEPIVLLFAVRDGHPTRLREAGLPELRLGGLGDEDAARLLDVHAPALAPDARRRLLDEAAGNPLALEELPRALQWADADPISPLTPLPITERLERAFSDRVSALPDTTRTLLLLAALDGGGGVPEVLEAATALLGQRVTIDDLVPAEANGLVTVGETGVRFRHPLIRTAISGAAPAATRQAAHVALADAHAGDPDRRVWHRAASLTGPDDDVAAELEAAAARAAQRGAPAVAAAALERALQLTADPASCGSLLLRSAEMEFELGRSDLALRLLAQARPLELGGDYQARLALLAEAADQDSWSGPARVAGFAEIAARLARTDEPAPALRAFLAVARSCWWGNATQDTRDLVVAAVERLDVPEDHPALLAVLGCADPVGRGAVVGERIARMTPDASGEPVAMHLVGTAATTVWAFDRSMGFLKAAVDGLRAQGRLGQLAQALVSQSWAAVHLGKAPLALSSADEAARLATETGQPRWATAADLARATVAGERGDFDAAEALAAEAEAALLPVGAQGMLALVQFARGRGAVAHQQYAEGYNQLRRILDPDDVAYHPFVGSWALADLVEAAANVGLRDEADGYLEQLEALAARTSGPFLQAALGYARPILAADEQAEELYLAGLGRDLASWPCFRGRQLLAYGRWLRRQRRVAESRAPLRAARESFDALGFDGLSESARQELRASGEGSVRRAPDLRDELTPQERQIAQMAAEGLSNREIGQRLYLSHRTVGSHLYRIFPKLGISSRGQLPAMLDGAAS